MQQWQRIISECDASLAHLELNAQRNEQRILHIIRHAFPNSMEKLWVVFNREGRFVNQDVKIAN